MTITERLAIIYHVAICTIKITFATIRLNHNSLPGIYLDIYADHLNILKDMYVLLL